MNTKRYIANPALDLAVVDANTIAIMQPAERFSIKGTNISVAVESIIDCFRAPLSFDDAILLLPKKYSTKTLNKMLAFLAEKKVLIDECDAEAQLQYKGAFLEKTFLYTERVSLQEILEKLAALRIGIIGTYQLVRCILSDLLNGELLLNFGVGITDSKVAISDICDCAHIMIYDVISDSSHIQSFVEESDFIIVGSNFRNHYLFNLINKLCVNLDKKWLRVVIEGMNVEVGPLFVPEQTCCYSCLQTRMLGNMTSEEIAIFDVYADIQIHEAEKEESLRFSSFYPLNPLASGIANSEIMKHLVGMTCNLENQVLTIDGRDYSMKLDYVYKDYRGPICM